MNAQIKGLLGDPKNCEGRKISKIFDFQRKKALESENCVGCDMNYF